ncbi:MAG: MaoC family dehydratase [Opitutaceae bacterium]|nr:MaoC family dehydratase [Cytophagales bacterium]
MIEAGQIYKYSFTFTQQEVDEFARVTGDNNPLHLDAHYAANTPFKKPIIHGFLGGSVFSKILGTKFPGEGTVYLKQNMEFLRPMFVETPYEAILEVKEVEKEKNKALIQTNIIDVSAQKIVVRGEASVMNKEKIQ